jgi:DNA repair photolyase
MSSVIKHYVKPEKALKKATMVDPSFFPGKYSFSPYMACEHACKYCDGRAEKYYVEGDFEKDIVIRENLPELLEKELKKLREKGIISIGSGISDPYQPVEKEEKILQKCAEILATHKFPVSVMTKSSLILRDIDLWEEVHKKNGFILTVSLTFTDDKLRNIFEPHADTVEERIKTLIEFKKRGIFTGILAMPFIPYISDVRENIGKLADIARHINVDFVMPGTLTLRQGKQKDLFMDIIKEKFPHLSENIKELYKENRQSGSPLLSYRKNLYKSLNEIFFYRSIPVETPHYVYKNLVPLYDEIYILLHHMINLYGRKNINTLPLKESLKRYGEWISKEKELFNRKRKGSYKDLEEKLISLIHFGEMGDIIKNEKLHNFIGKIVLERRTFDYMNLNLF